MARRPRAALGAALLLLAGLAAAAAVAAPIALAGDPCFHGYTIPAATTASTTAVSMEPCAFVPTNVQVAAGATVRFTNASEDVHLLTGANQAWGDREQEILPGGSVAVTFESPGVYAFSCALHRGMSGAVIVGGADTSAADADSAVGTTANAGTRPGGDTGAGLLEPIAIAGLAAVAAIGWGVAIMQRRRGAPVQAERQPTG